MKTRLALHFATVAASLLSVFSAPTLVRAAPPKILEFRVQEVNQKIYFHVRVQRPADMAPENQDRGIHTTITMKRNAVKQLFAACGVACVLRHKRQYPHSIA